MSKRTYLVREIDKRLRRAADLNVPIAIGGGTVLATPQHALDGPEHTEAAGTADKLATAGHSGLLLPLSGDAGDALLGDGTWGPTGAGDMLKSVYDTDDDGKVDVAERLTTSQTDMYSDAEDDVLKVKSLDANSGMYFLIQPNGQPTSGDTSWHVYYSRTSEGAAHELFLGAGAWHGQNKYLFASGDSNDTSEPLPILFIMERGTTHYNIMLLDTDSTVLFYKHLRLSEIAAPSTPASGEAALYVKGDGHIYLKNDAGTEYDLTGSIAALDDLSDVTLGIPADGEKLIYDDGAWRNVVRHTEVLMTDGISGPPDPMLNEAEDDWLYGEVTG